MVSPELLHGCSWVHKHKELPPLFAKVQALVSYPVGIEAHVIPRVLGKHIPGKRFNLPYNEGGGCPLGELLPQLEIQCFESITRPPLTPNLLVTLKGYDLIQSEVNDLR